MSDAAAGATRKCSAPPPPMHAAVLQCCSAGCRHHADALQLVVTVSLVRCRRRWCWCPGPVFVPHNAAPPAAAQLHLPAAAERCRGAASQHFSGEFASPGSAPPAASRQPPATSRNICCVLSNPNLQPRVRADSELAMAMVNREQDTNDKGPHQGSSY